MHNSRLFALVGVGIAIIGLFVKGLRTAGEGLLPTLSQSDAGFPDGLPTIWGGLPTWAQILLVILLAVVVALAFWRRHDDPLERTPASIVAVIGLATLGYAVVKWIDASDKADALQAAFLQANQAGLTSTAYSVSTSVGFVILLVGTVLVVFGGVVSLRSDDEAFF